MKNRKKTMSKWFYNDEILAKEENGTLHLKEGVKRVHSWPQLKDMGMTFNIEGESEHINEYRLVQDKLDVLKQIKEEERNFDD